MYFKGFYSEHSSGGGNGLTTIIFYNYNDNTVVNSEINSSITAYTPTRNPKYRNGYAVWNASNLTSLDQVSKINAGSATQPVYFSGGKPVAATAYASASVNYATSAGTATDATNATNTTNINTLADNSTNAARFILFSDAATGNQRAKTDTGLKYNPSSNTITATLAGNASSATKLQTARTM